MGHYPNTPNLMSSHSGFMTRMFYDAVLNIITSNEYCWSDVFPDIVFEGNNAKEETINLGRWQPFKTLTCRPIRGSLTGVTRCEGFLYVDDLVSGIEEALSIDRLDKLYGEYTTDLKSRKRRKQKRSTLQPDGVCMMLLAGLKECMRAIRGQSSLLFQTLILRPEKQL